MFVRVIIRKINYSTIVSSHFIKSVPKKNLFSNVKNIKREQQVAVRTYVSAVPEINNNSSQLEQNDNERKSLSESHIFYNYIKTDPQFSELTFREELVPEKSEKLSSLLTTLESFGSKSNITDEDLKGIIPLIERELKTLSFYELLEATNLTFKLFKMQSIDIWDHIRMGFDIEFLRRSKSLSINEVLMICSVLNTFKILKKFDFAHQFICKLVYKVDKLTHPQFVHFFYNLIQLGYISCENFKFNFMNFINERIPSLNQMDLGILATAFNIVEMKFNPPLYVTLMKKVLSEMENMDPIVISCISKSLGRVIKVENVEMLMEFQEKLIPLVPKFKNDLLRSLVYSGISFRYLNMALYDEVMKRVKSDMANFSLLNISGLVFLNATFNIDDNEFFDMAVNEFERRDDIQKNYLAYVKFLANLIHFQIHPKNLLDKVLSNDVFSTTMRKKSGRFAWAYVKWSLEIEKPELKFPEVDNELYARLLKQMKYGKAAGSLEFAYQFKLKCILRQIYGENSICTRRISFHHPRCCMMRFDKNLKAQQIPENFKESANDFRMRPPNDDHIWVCIFPLHREYYADFRERKINYRGMTHVRQLAILGYKHIYITPPEWYHCVIKQPLDPSFFESLMTKKLQELTGKIQTTESEN